MKNIASYIAVYLLLILTNSVSLFCQDSDSIENQWMLSAFRGTWEHETYDEVFSINVQSDTKLLMNREPAAYSLSGNNLTIFSDERTYLYHFEITNDKLLLIDSDNKKVVYQRKDYGENEQTLVGTFYVAEDSTLLSPSLQFFEDGSYIFIEPKGQQTPGSTNNFLKREGLFRVESNIVTLSFEDRGLEQAQTRYRTDDNLVDGILFRDKLYNREIQYATTATQEINSISSSPHQDVTIFVADPTPPSGSCPMPIRPIGGPHLPVGPSHPVENNPPAQTTQPDKHRDFGANRGSTNEPNAGNAERKPSRDRKPD